MNPILRDAAASAFAAALLCLCSCASPFDLGCGQYQDAVSALQDNPATARAGFVKSQDNLNLAILGGLETADQVTAASCRLRGLIELDRHIEASALLRKRIPGFDPLQVYGGDRVGVSLLRAQVLGPDRAYAELVQADVRASTERARLFIVREQAQALRKMGTPKAKAEARNICDRNAGKLDFDDLKKQLSESP